jgi:hypothetical protein
MSVFPGSEAAYQTLTGGAVFGPRQERALQRLSSYGSPNATQPQYQVTQDSQRRPEAAAPPAPPQAPDARQPQRQHSVDMSWASPAAAQSRQMATVRPNSKNPIVGQVPAGARSPAMQKAMQENDGRSANQRLVDIQRAQNKERIWA